MKRLGLLGVSASALRLPFTGVKEELLFTGVKPLLPFTGVNPPEFTGVKPDASPELEGTSGINTSLSESALSFADAWSVCEARTAGDSGVSPGDWPALSPSLPAGDAAGEGVNGPPYSAS